MTSHVKMEAALKTLRCISAHSTFFDLLVLVTQHTSDIASHNGFFHLILVFSHQPFHLFDVKYAIHVSLVFVQLYSRPVLSSFSLTIHLVEA